MRLYNTCFPTCLSPVSLNIFSLIGVFQTQFEHSGLESFLLFANSKEGVASWGQLPGDLQPGGSTSDVCLSKRYGQGTCWRKRDGHLLPWEQFLVTWASFSFNCCCHQQLVGRHPRWIWFPIRQACLYNRGILFCRWNNTVAFLKWSSS